MLVEHPELALALAQLLAARVQRMTTYLVDLQNQLPTTAVGSAWSTSCSAAWCTGHRAARSILNGSYGCWS
jgi:hypothetical protein